MYPIVVVDVRTTLKTCPHQQFVDATTRKQPAASDKSTRQIEASCDTKLVASTSAFNMLLQHVADTDGAFQRVA